MTETKVKLTECHINLNVAKELWDILTQIHASPLLQHTWNQSDWRMVWDDDDFQVTPEMEIEARRLGLDTNTCGTAMCAAGWVGAIGVAEGKVKWSNSDYVKPKDSEEAWSDHVSDYARKELFPGLNQSNWTDVPLNLFSGACSEAHTLSKLEFMINYPGDLNDSTAVVDAFMDAYPHETWGRAHLFGEA